MTPADLTQYEQQFRTWVLGNMGLVGLGLGGACAASAGLGMRRRRAHRAERQESHGAAQWATPAQIRQAGLCARHGVVLGRCEGQHWGHSGDILFDDSEGSVLLCGAPGSLKDQSTNLPTTFFWQGSLVILDVKKHGENYQRLGKWRQQFGPVYRFAPTQAGSDHINLLDTIRRGQAEEWRDTTMLLDAMHSPDTKMQDTPAAKFYRSNDVEVLRAGTLYTLHRPDLPDDARHFPGVLQLLGNPKAALAGMQRSHHPMIREAAQKIAGWTTDVKQHAWSGAAEALAIYRDPRVARHTTRSSFSLTDLQYAETPVTLYVMAETPGDVQYLSPLFRPLMQRMLTVLQQQETGHAWPLLWILNEFHTLGYMAFFEHEIAVGREYGIRFLIVVQGLGQLLDVFGERTALWESTVTKIFYAQPNPDTAARITQKMIGETTVAWENAQTSASGWGRRTWGQTEQRTRRWLLEPAELVRLPKDRAIVLHDACPPPIRCGKVRYWHDREFRKARRGA